jgi:hypothetical protein
MMSVTSRCEFHIHSASLTGSSSSRVISSEKVNDIVLVKAGFNDTFPKVGLPVRIGKTWLEYMPALFVNTTG